MCSQLQKYVLNSNKRSQLQKYGSNYYARLRRVPQAKKSACAPYMCFEFVLLSNMSGNDLRRTWRCC